MNKLEELQMMHEVMLHMNDDGYHYENIMEKERFGKVEF